VDRSRIAMTEKQSGLDTARTSRLHKAHVQVRTGEPVGKAVASPDRVLTHLAGQGRRVMPCLRVEVKLLHADVHA